MVQMTVNGMSIRPEINNGSVSVDYYDDVANEQVSVELIVSRVAP
ncbi:hypothetical protein [Mycobacterium colombiense]|nr:hypothetical protein [Mycobacterium colombiense]